jgi:RNA polymerase sigma factor (sigma-70 family)
VKPFEREQQWALLMRAAIQGDDAAYRNLLAMLAVALRAMARRGCERAKLAKDDVEDIVQESRLAIHLKRHTWRPEDPIGPWIAAIARNKLVDALRRRGRRLEIAIDDVAAIVPTKEAPTSLASRDIERMLSHLSARQGEIVRCVSIEGHSARETAKLLNMSEGAVRVSLHRALKALAAIYRESTDRAGPT